MTTPTLAEMAKAIDNIIAETVCRVVEIELRLFGRSSGDFDEKAGLEAAAALLRRLSDPSEEMLDAARKAFEVALMNAPDQSDDESDEAWGAEIGRIGVRAALTELLTGEAIDGWTHPTAPHEGMAGVMARLKELSDRAAPGKWAYRPCKYDDWGLIRGGGIKDATIGMAYPPVASSRPLWHDYDFAPHQASGTDPMAANGEFIVALVNAYRDGRLVEVERPKGDTQHRGISMDALRQANRDRQAEWPGNDRIDTAFRALEVAGEAGELCEAVKKFIRGQRGIAGSTATLDDIAAEMGDVVIGLDLLADDLGIDLAQAVSRKFNSTSQKYGMATRLNAVEPPAPLPQGEGE